jgi:chemotaxis protein MotB
VADDQNNQPIIIKKKKGRHGGHHGGAWKVALADFMTAMMAFFLVMWLVGQKDDVREAVAGYFRDPGTFSSSGEVGILKGAAQVIKSKNPDVSVINPPKKGESLPSEDEHNSLLSTAKKILTELEKQKAFNRLRKNIKIQMTSEGLRIILNESENAAAFFEPGSAKLLQKSAIILVKIAEELGKLENRIVIEGHTDGAFAGQTGYSNWELSADRANAARQLMEVSGFTENQVREVRGFADRFPMITGRPNDARNRRITLVVLYQAMEQAYDKVEVEQDMLSGL